MSLTINTNISSLITQRNLNNATKLLNNSIERMTTGYKINHAKDNAAGYSIATNWVTKLGSLDVASDNAAMGADLLTTAEDTYAVISSHLQRIRDLVEQASNGTYGLDSLKAIHAEIVARVEEMYRISSNCEYNGIKLLDGNFGDVRLQVGIDGGDNSKIELSSTLFTEGNVYGLFKANESDMNDLLKKADSAGGTAIMTDLKVPTDAATLAKFQKGVQIFAAACTGLQVDNATSALSVNTNVHAEAMLAQIDAAMNTISTNITQIGAVQNRIESAMETIGIRTQNLTSSLSTLRDSDVAEESSNYIKAQILQQAAATLLSTANQAPSIALNLI